MDQSVIHSLLLLILAFIVSACDGLNVTRDKTYKYLSKEDPYNTTYRGHYKVGKTYKIKGKSYTPKRVTRYTKTGVASWYGAKCGSHGKVTANGEIFNKNLLTAAHKTLPLPSLVKVTNLENGRSLIVMVNDRGPYAYNREIDMSEKAASILGFKNKGTAKVKVKYLHKDTMQFLEMIGLRPKEGSKTSKSLESTLCTVNCHIKLMNLKHRKKQQQNL